MAIATPTLTGHIPIEREAPWAVNYVSDSFIAGGLAAELKAAPTRDNSALYLTHVTMSNRHCLYGTTRIYDVALTLYDGGGNVLLGPIQLQENGDGVFSKDFKDPIKAVDKKALDVSGSGPAAGYQARCVIYIEGFTADAPLG